MDVRVVFIRSDGHHRTKAVKKEENFYIVHVMTFTCCIPMYCEESRITLVLDVLQKVTSIKHIIIVDDGSRDASVSEVLAYKKKFPLVSLEIYKHKINQGKTAAIKTALKYVQTEYVFLCDADLGGLSRVELDNALIQTKKNKDIDMMMLRRRDVSWKIKILYKELLLTGQRIVRTSTLRDILQKEISNYQLEVAINEYMFSHKKNCFRLPYSGHNPHKSTKRGWKEGILKDLGMGRQILRYLGPLTFIRHCFFYSPRRYT